jgi:hypothetical protein
VNETDREASIPLTEVIVGASGAVTNCKVLTEFWFVKSVERLASPDGPLAKTIKLYAVLGVSPTNVYDVFSEVIVVVEESIASSLANVLVVKGIAATLYSVTCPPVVGGVQLTSMVVVPIVSITRFVGLFGSG